MNIRIQFTRQTVKALLNLRHQACKQDHIRLVRRISVLLEYVVYQTPVTILSERWGISPACVYEWLSAFLVQGLDSLAYRYRGGRKAKLTSNQKKRLCEVVDAGPQAAGFDTACWNSILIQQVIKREFGVEYSSLRVGSSGRSPSSSLAERGMASDLEGSSASQGFDPVWRRVQLCSMGVVELYLVPPGAATDRQDKR